MKIRIEFLVWNLCFLFTTKTQVLSYRFHLQLDKLLNESNKDSEYFDILAGECKAKPNNTNEDLDSASLLFSCKKEIFLVNAIDLEVRKWDISSSRRLLRNGIAIFDDPSSIPSKSDIDLSFGDFLNYEVNRQPVLITDIPSLVLEETSWSALNDCVTSKRNERNRQKAQHMPSVEVQMKGTPSISEENESNKWTTDTLVEDNGPLFIPIESDCSNFNSSLDILLPKYVTNDYLRRAMRLTGSSHYSELFLQAVVLRPSNVISPTRATCPSSLHGLYIPIPSPGTLSGKISARIFENEGISVLDPVLIVDTQAFPSYSYEFQNNHLKIDSTYFREINIDFGTALFVPSDHVAAFHVEENEVWDKATLLRFCFLDASNLNSFKEHIRVESILDSSSHELFATINDPSFDISMVREVPRISKWNDDPTRSRISGGGDTHEEISSSFSYSTNRQLSRGDRRKKSSFTEWQLGKSWDHRIVGLTLPTMLPPQIIDNGRRNVTLTWLSPFIKKEGDSTSVGYIVSWVGYEGGRISPLPLAGNVTIDEGDLFINEGKSAIKIEHVTDEKSRPYGSPLRKFTCIISNLEAYTHYTFKVAMFYGHEKDRSHGLFSAPSKIVLTDPPSLPFPVSSPPIVVPPKAWDSELKTERGEKFVPSVGSDSTLAVVKIHAPYDDGGVKLVGYDVMRMHLDSFGHMEGQWVLISYGVEVLKSGTDLGGLVYIGIHNLIPGGTYVFKVAARNAIGRSKWSAASHEATTFYYPSGSNSSANNGWINPRKLMAEESHGYMPKADHSLYGIGTNRLFTPHNHVVVGPIATIDDIRQKVRIQKVPKVEIDVWTSFWSPRGFHVTGELCWVEWKQDGKISNDRDIESRIAVVSRTSCKEYDMSMASIAAQSQRSGAIGVLIVDDGQCSSYDQYCILGSSKILGDYWGELDLPSAWNRLMIPVVFVMEQDDHGKFIDLIKI